MFASGIALMVRLLRWWISELAALLPRGWRAALASRRRRVIIALGGQTAQVQLCQRSGLQDLGTIHFPVEAGRSTNESCPEILKRFRDREVEVVLRLPEKTALHHVVDLPIAASENLREVIGFEIDRLTPFRAKEVYFDYSGLSKDKTANLLSVDLVVVARASVDAAVSRLRSWGLHIDRVDIAGGRGREAMNINLMPLSPGRASRRRLGLTALAAFGLCFLCVTAIYLPLMQKQNLVAKTDARLETARDQAAEAKALSEQVERLISTGAFVIEQKQGRPSVAEVMSLITDVLPDDTWVIQLNWAGDRLTLAGYSASSSSLIAALEETALLSEVRFNSPVTIDQRVGLERFSLSARVLGRHTS